MRNKKYITPDMEIVYVNMYDVLTVSDFYFNEVDNGDLGDDWGSDFFDDFF